MTVMAGGESEDVEAIRPIMDDLAANFTQMGPVGAGQTTKVINQAIVGVGYLMMAETVILAEAAGNRLHIHHLSTRQGAEQVLWAKRRSVPVTCEVLISHLLLDETAYERYGNLIQLNPPIRMREHVEYLWTELNRGHVECVATDHAPHSLEEQERSNVWEGVGGFIGVETLLPLLLDCVAKDRTSLERAVRISSENPARLYGLYPRKGSLEVGADADFALVDLKASYRLSDSALHSKHPVSPYNGWRVRGRPVATYVRGLCVVREGELLSSPAGQMLRPGYGEQEDPEWT